MAVASKPDTARMEQEYFMSKLISLPVTTALPTKHQTHKEWNETLASSIALLDDLMLNEAHMEVLHYLRRSYARFGQIRSAHSLLLALETRFALQGGKQFLQSLFPRDAVRQACLLAGIPAPLDLVIGPENKKRRFNP